MLGFTHHSSMWRFGYSRNAKLLPLQPRTLPSGPASCRNAHPSPVGLWRLARFFRVSLTKPAGLRVGVAPSGVPLRKGTAMQKSTLTALRAGVAPLALAMGFVGAPA